MQGKDGDGHEVVVLAAYAGDAKDGAIHFRSTSRLRSIAGGAPEVLAPVTMIVKSVPPGLDVRIGNDAEGVLTLRLAREGAGTTDVAAAIRGEWGGPMPHVDLGENVTLEELYVSVPTTGALAADVRMECVVVKSEQRIPVTIVVNCRDGQPAPDGVRFPIVPWHRTVHTNGQKDDIAGNPLVLRTTPDGRLSGNFEGEQGMVFTLPRQGSGATGTASPSNATPPPASATPAVPPAPVGFDDYAGSRWGGAFNDAKLNDQLLIREGQIDLARASDGVWTATVHMTFVVKTPSEDVVVRVDGSYPQGQTKGDSLSFPGVSLTRTIVSTGATNPMDGNPLEIRREPDGRSEVKFVGDGGFTLQMVRR